MALGSAQRLWATWKGPEPLWSVVLLQAQGPARSFLAGHFAEVRPAGWQPMCMR